MKNNTNSIRSYFALFTPSAVSAVVSVFLIGLIIVLNQFSSIQQYLQLPTDFSITGLLTRWLDTLLTSTIGESSTATLVVGVFWAFVGLGVYIFLRGIARFISELGEGYDQRGYVWPKDTDRNRPLVEAAERTVFRILAFVVLMIVVFGLLVRIVEGPIWTTFIGPSIPLQIVFWFVAGILTMHACVVLVRLIALKSRLFD